MRDPLNFTLLKNSLTFFAMIHLVGCQVDQNMPNYYTALKTELLKYDKDVSNYNKIFVLSEHGCPGCSKSFYYLITDDVINKEGTLLYSTSIGVNEDFSILHEESVTNHVLGSPSLPSSLGLPDESIYIEINGEQIDTIIRFTASNLEPALNYIKSRL